MINTTLKRFSHKVGLNFWHLEWCTKYSYNMMRKLKNKNLVEASIRKTANGQKITIHFLSVLFDHVYMLCTFPRGMLDSEAFRLLKGGSSYKILRIMKVFDYAILKAIFGVRADVQSLLDTMIYNQ